VRWLRGRSGRDGGDGGDRRKVLFVTDLHGSELTFRKLLGALEAWRPDVYIGGGDVAGKAVVPVAQLGGDRFRLSWMGEEHELEGREELERFEQRISQLGFYPYVAPLEEIQRVRADPAATDQVFERLIAERWADWLRRLDERCRRLEIPAYVIAGNDDPWSLDSVTFGDREWVTAVNGEVVPVLGEWSLVSCGLGNRTPWNCPRDVSEEELAERLEQLSGGVGDFATAITNLHVPPYGSSLDLAAKLDTSVSPPRVVLGDTAPVGSTAVRDFLLERQPLLSLHGHVHESRGAVRLGRTWALNPGSEYAEGVLRAALVTLEPSNVVSHQLLAV
jgi:Icc-related predicted phosphoesterase